MPDLQFDAYDAFYTHIVNKRIDIDTDTLKATLHAAAYAPNLATDDFANDATNELTTASGYTAGGVTLANPSLTVVAANSWSKVRANSTAYRLGEIIRPASTNGFVYRVSTAGTSGGSPPTFPTVVGVDVADGTAVITCVGTKVLRFTTDPVVWAAPFAAGPFQRVVISDTTPGTAATNPLMFVASYAAPQTGADGSWTITPDSGNGWWSLPLP